MILTHLQWSDGSELRILALHTLKPIAPSKQIVRDKQLRQLAEVVASDPEPTLVMGDFNMTVGDVRWRELRASSQLERPAREVASWPSSLGGFGIGIDQLLGRGIAIGAVQPVRLPGSDHRGITAEIGPGP